MEKIIKLCKRIRADVEKDVEELEGKPFNGKTVATHFGFHAAAINSLLDMVELMANKIEQLEGELEEKTTKVDGL